MKLNQLDGINKNELSMIEVAHAILEEGGDVLNFNDLMIKIQDYLGLSDADLESKMTRFYTDLNIDGSFISLGENRWGLRSWYPIDSIDEEILSSIDEDEVKVRRKKRRKINAFASYGEDEDVIDYNDDDPEDTYELDDEEEDLDVSEDTDAAADEDVLDVDGAAEDISDIDSLDEDDDLTEGIEEDLTLIEEVEDFEDDDFEEEEYSDEDPADEE